MNPILKPIENKKTARLYSCKYIYSNEPVFKFQVEDILRRMVLEKDKQIVRIVFFAEITQNEEYRKKYEILARVIYSHFGENQPVWCLVAEPPLEASLAAEVHCRRVKKGERFACRQMEGVACVTIETEKTKELFFSVSSFAANASRLDQAREAFDVATRILRQMGMSPDSIVRQWNYVEQITGLTARIQNYQALNDARADFYALANWENGYPAATGIGMLAGGIIVDINAVSGYSVYPIDNRMQVAAYDYSEKKLVVSDRTKGATPKFERAKRVVYPGQELVYVSGTAAIRGEDSEYENAESQTRTTLENIRELLSSARGCGIDSARVYVKQVHDFEAIRKTLLRQWKDVPALYLQADVCRPELLVEIESLALV